MKKYQKNKKKSLKIRKDKNNIRKKKIIFGHYRIKLIMIYFIIFCLISSICIFLSSAVLLKTNEIDVLGDEICDSNFLIEKSGIKIGDNLLFIDSKYVKNKLEREVPEIDTVEIIKRFPNKFVINVRSAKKTFAIKSNEKYIFISEKGKVLEISDIVDDVIILNGAPLESFEIGKEIVFKDKSFMRNLLEFTVKMKNNNLSKITEINFNNGCYIYINYDNRIKINFGYYENIDCKIKTAAEIINNKLGAAESGELDVSEVFKENRSYFTPSY